jgi:hypothetical protein
MHRDVCQSTKLPHHRSILHNTTLHTYTTPHHTCTTPHYTWLNYTTLHHRSRKLKTGVPPQAAKSHTITHKPSPRGMLVCVCLFMLVCAYIKVRCVRVCLCDCMRIYIYTHTHTHTHTRIYTQGRLGGHPVGSHVCVCGRERVWNCHSAVHSGNACGVIPSFIKSTRIHAYTSIHTFTHIMC